MPSLEHLKAAFAVYQEACCASQTRVLSYEVQITQGDPATEAAWQHLTMLPNLRRALLEGLPGGPLWIRVRAFTKDGYGAWTTPLSVLMG